MRIVFAVMFLYLVVPASLAYDKSDETKCKNTEKQIRWVESKMRSGYTRAQGEKLEARLRKLRAERSKYCR